MQVALLEGDAAPGGAAGGPQGAAGLPQGTSWQRSRPGAGAVLPERPVSASVLPDRFEQLLAEAEQCIRARSASPSVLRGAHVVSPMKRPDTCQTAPAAAPAGASAAAPAAAPAHKVALDTAEACSPVPAAAVAAAAVITSAAADGDADPERGDDDVARGAAAAGPPPAAVPGGSSARLIEVAQGWRPIQTPHMASSVIAATDRSLGS